VHQFACRDARDNRAVHGVFGTAGDSRRSTDTSSRQDLWLGRGGFNIAELIDVVRDAALDRKGEDFTTIDVSGRTILADTFALITGRSKIQTRAIADAIVERAESEGFTVTRVEGYNEGTWILIDLGHVIVHVFTAEQRQFYNLERLWAEVEKRQAQSS
jgi:ribosome-associated protein